MSQDFQNLSFSSGNFHEVSSDSFAASKETQASPGKRLQKKLIV
jgi:hypothetical protein